MYNLEINQFGNEGILSGKKLRDRIS